MMSFWRFVLQCLLIFMVIIPPARAADGCERGSVRCGQNCTGYRGYCTCGAGEERFNRYNDTVWCCNGDQCEKRGNDIICAQGNQQALTTPCNGQCNDHRSFGAARQYTVCKNRRQCIKTQFWQDDTFHCKDRSDEDSDNHHQSSQESHMEQPDRMLQGWG